MSNPIDRLLDSGLHRTADLSARARSQANKPGAESNAALRSGELLDLTGRAKALQALENDLASTPEFDAGRVALLRQSLADGSYQVDARRIAEKLLAMDSKLP